MKYLKIIFPNVLFYLLFIVHLFISCILFFLCAIILALFLDKRSLLKRLRRGITYYGWGIIYVLPFPFVRIKYKDLSKERKEGPFIFVCNHKSASDPFLMACLPHECIQIVNIWPFKIPILGRVAKWAGYLSVKEMPFKEFSFKAIKLLNEGVSVIVFPEGTRSGAGQVGQFNSSMFRIALESHYPIVPLCLYGNENIPPRGTILLQPGIIKINRLPSVKWEEYKDYNAFKLKNVIRDIIINELANMEKQ